MQQLNFASTTTIPRFGVVGCQDSDFLDCSEDCEAKGA